MNTRRFDRFVGYARGGGLMWLTLLLATPAVAQSVGDRWQQADALEQQGRFLEAGEAYAAILAAEPQSQQAAVKRAVCQYKAGQAVEAVDGLERAVQMAPFAGWAGMGLYYHALACRDAGCPDVARDCLARLKAHFPDSPWTTRAEVLDGQLDGADTPSAQARLARELEADALYREYRKKFPVSPDRDDAGALAALDRIMTEYPDTRTALMARRSEAYVLAQDLNRTQEATAALQTLLADVSRIAPHCETVYMLKKSLGAIFQRNDMRKEAMEAFAALAESAQDPAVVADATLQAAGAHNEMMQRRQALGEAVSADDWEAVREHCRQVKALKQATPFQHARADLIIVETYFWQHQPDLAQAGAEEYIGTHDGKTWRREVATARMILGECLQRNGRHQEALAHYRWIISEFGEEEIWPGLTNPEQPHYFPMNLARTWYRIYDALRRGGGSAEEVAAAGTFAVTHYPDSVYAERIRSAMARDGQ